MASLKVRAWLYVMSGGSSCMCLVNLKISDSEEAIRISP